MSLDFYLDDAKTCTACGRGGERLYSANITHNVSPMWIRAGVHEALYRSEGRTAAEIIPALEKGVEHMATHPDEYTPMNPENGWGSYASALTWLRHVLAACRAHPHAAIRVSA